MSEETERITALGESIAGYMAHRIVPWGDEATMREAVQLATRLLCTEALADLLCAVDRDYLTWVIEASL